VVIAGLLALASAVVAVGPLGRLPSPDELSAAVSRLGVAGPLALVALMIIAVVVGPIPTFPVSVTAGLAYGPVLGTVYAVVGATIGALAAFGLARYAGRPVAARWLRGHVAFCRDCSDRTLFWVVLGARLVPVVSFALASYAAGLTAMSARAFALATALGMLPMTLVYVTLGATLQLSLAWFAAAGALVAVLMLAGPRWLERRAPGLMHRLTRGAHAGHSAAGSSGARNGERP
jgi:uncharacterized membrane protein YdjX (TVP38/TMEM64 family)